MAGTALPEGYAISDDPARLQPDAAHAFLTESYWARGISAALVAESMRNSLCIGVYAPGGAQIGLVRVISDYVTFAYFCDVYVLEAHRGKGLSKAAMDFALAHPRLQNLRRMGLVTLDAHGLYARYGFAPLGHPERHMEKLDPGVYARIAAASPS